MTGQILADAFTRTGTTEAVIFWFLAPVALIGAFGMVLSRNAVHAALWLVLVMFCLSVFYVVENAPFLGLVQVIVYAGAIMVLFLFVIMLIGVDFSDSLVETLRGQRIAAIVLGLGFAGMLIFPIARSISKTRARPAWAKTASTTTSTASRSCSSAPTCGPSRSSRRCSSLPPSARWCSATESAFTGAPSANARFRARAVSTVRSPRCRAPAFTRGMTRSTVRRCCPMAVPLSTASLTSTRRRSTSGFPRNTAWTAGRLPRLQRPHGVRANESR